MRTGANIHLGGRLAGGVRATAALLIIALAVALVDGPAAAGEVVRVGYYVIDASRFQDDEQYQTAEIVNDILVQHIELQFDQEAGIYANVERLYERLDVDQEGSAALARALAQREMELVLKRSLDLVIVGEFTTGERGYLVRVVAVDLRPGPGQIDWRGTPSLAVLRPTANFVDIEEKIVPIAKRIARRFTGIEVRGAVQERTVTPVLFWCIQSAKPKDPELSLISRRLTLELPFFLTEHRFDLAAEYEFTGMSSRDYIGECLEGGTGLSDPRRPYLAFDRYAYVVSGVANVASDRAGDPMITVEFLVDWRSEGYGIPRRMIGIPPELDKHSLDKTAQRFLKTFSSVVKRELVKSVQANLSALGFYPATIDGVFGPATRAAIAEYQEKFGLEVTGTVTPELAETLRKTVRR